MYMDDVYYGENENENEYIDSGFEDHDDYYWKYIDFTLGFAQ